MANKPSGEKVGHVQNNIIIYEVQKIEIGCIGDSSDDSIATCMEEVRTELEKAGVVPLRHQQQGPEFQVKAPLLKGRTVLRIAALAGVFVLAYKGFDIILLAAYSPEGSQGVVKSMREWVTALAPIIVGLTATAGVAYAIRRRPGRGPGED